MTAYPQELLDAYKELSNLTAARCGGPDCYTGSCPKWRCCDKLYCDLARDWALRQGVELKPTGHEIPFMGPTGCIVPPHLRPICTTHLCSINSFGTIPKQPELTKRYFELREKIDIMEWERDERKQKEAQETQA